MDRIALGSGKLYGVLYSGSIPEDDNIETDANKMGDISGGASLEYKETTYKAVDDSGQRTKTVTTDEEAKLKTGIMTWNGLLLKKLARTARVTEAAGKRTVKIGGLLNQSGDKYLIRFLHEDAVDGDCRLTLVGNNTAGITLAFVKNKETIVNAEFDAAPCDSEGTLIIYEEEIIPEQTLAVTSIAGTLAGDTKINVLPAKTGTNTYKYKVGQFIESPEAGDTLTGYTAWDGLADITAPTGHTIVIVEVNTSGTAVFFGTATVISKA